MSSNETIGQNVCAVIVTYHPAPQMIAHMASIRPQVDRMVVVDNGSKRDEVELLQQASVSVGFHLIENAENLGIAEALNQGVLWAKGHGFVWVLLFDQDSKITENFVAGMFSSWEGDGDRASIGSLQPKYLNPETGLQHIMPLARDGGPMTSMTSGSLMPTWIFDRIGLFAADYFIDLVDCEYCLRIRAAGFRIVESQQATLLHKAGSPERKTVLGFSFGPTHHSPMRRYYMSRNRIVVYRKYLGKFPAWVFHSMLASFRETVKCFIAENERRKKFRNFLLGTWDGLFGRMGRRDDL